MRQQLTAWIALFAMLSGMAMPAHAYRSHAPTGLPGADLCTSVKPVEVKDSAQPKATTNAPAPPAEDHALQCGTCCGCSGSAATPALLHDPHRVVARLAPSAAAPDVDPSTVTRFALARGPPARA